jgi:hypothetical protein
MGLVDMWQRVADLKSMAWISKENLSQFKVKTEFSTRKMLLAL